jgi:hypothetical protein
MQVTYCYSYSAATGLSMRMVPPGYVAASGEFLSSPEPASEATLEAQFPGYSGVGTALNLYALNKAARIEAGGITVNIAASGQPAQNVECATDPLSYARVSAAAAVAIANPSETVMQVFPSGVVTLTAAQVETIFAAISNFYVAVQATLGAVVTAIAAGTITTTAQIDAPPSPIAAWPANS